MLKVSGLTKEEYDDIFEVLKNHCTKKQYKARILSDGKEWINEEARQVKKSKAQLAREANLAELKRLAVNLDGEPQHYTYQIVKVEGNRKKCAEWQCENRLVDGCYGYYLYNNTDTSLSIRCPSCTRKLMEGDFDLNVFKACLLEAANTPRTTWVEQVFKFVAECIDVSIDVPGVGSKWAQKDFECRVCKDHVSEDFIISLKGRFGRNVIGGEYNFVEDKRICSSCALILAPKQWEVTLENRRIYDSLVDPNFNALACKGCINRPKCMTNLLASVNS